MPPEQEVSSDPTLILKSVAGEFELNHKILEF